MQATLYVALAPHRERYVRASPPVSSSTRTGAPFQTRWFVEPGAGR